MNLLILTWNMNSKQAPYELNDLLLPEQLLYLPDMYVIGVQESVSSSNSDVKELEVRRQRTLVFWTGYDRINHEHHLF